MPLRKSKPTADVLSELMPVPEAVPSQKSSAPKRAKKVSIKSGESPRHRSAKPNSVEPAQARQEIRELFNTTLMFEEESDDSDEDEEQTPPPKPIITKNKEKCFV
jgi:hypothetical protein